MPMGSRCLAMLDAAMTLGLAIDSAPAADLRWDGRKAVHVRHGHSAYGGRPYYLPPCYEAPWASVMRCVPRVYVGEPVISYHVMRRPGSEYDRGRVVSVPYVRAPRPWWW
jgi:hypothetical protein